MLDRVRAVQTYHETAADYSIMGWVEGPAAEAADLRGVEQYLVDLLDDPDYACAVMDATVENAIKFARAQVDVGCEMIGIGDAIASQVGPALYEEYIQPREKHLVEAIHAMGVRVRIHICGDITPLLPGLADVGPDILDCDHMVGLAKTRKIMPPTTALCGNVDPVSIVLQGKPDTIREAVRRAYGEAGMPYVVGAGCEIPPGTPTENLRALCEPLSVS